MRRALAVLALLLPLAACTAEPADGKVTLNYWLWDDKQLPSYQTCADEFTKANPNVAIKFTQTAWSQYWQNLTTQLASGGAPDVWTDHASYYPQFVSSNQILDIQPFVERDGVDLGVYQAGLADLFVKDGKRYGLPKDWDTMALVYNTALVKDTTGLDALTWNPVDGGTFERAIAASTVDSQGRTGLDPAFDKANVKVYGFLPEWADGSQGQNGWGNLAVANGFTFLDKNPWGTRYRYDDPKLAQTIAWFTHLIDAGYAPRFDKQSTLGRDAVMDQGTGAFTFAGSWTISSYLGANAKQKYAFAPLPTGPAGRKTAINGLSDAIYAGTKHPDEAWAWVKFLGSAACQDIVGGNAVVFPAVRSGVEKALAAHKAAGRDVHVFTDQASAPGGTFFLPITDHGNEVSQIVQDAIQAVVLGQAAPAGALKKANDQVNALFK
ncbi:sugar ABC transporter substrate-binding protein [Virgisporangium aliadipatigenens]|uniref:Sugar ABC transporter substrate-binding protein n=1 Tax=Virgisporangium aliadipatigenens TaxID=741659 RepID=A0A8J4DU38_9ACTN|nr:sugar ABC transporter substrate-binding protein [Virgisporangium aliadipatigenens]GIJ50409.1 sugar ABC transporter substrate-binding protein [Virgisporangium aliadipatigenens]